jgi:transcriptional regulator with XRE-family HTH domain
MAKVQRSIDDIRPAELVAVVDISPSYASLLLAGKRRPSLGVAVQIERAFGIPVGAWLEPRTERAA